MARGKRTNMVIRRVAGTKTVDVYSMENAKLKKLDTIEVSSGKINETELAKRYGVTRVVTDVKESKTRFFGVPIDKFMEIAVELESENENTENTENKENTDQTANK